MTENIKNEQKIPKTESKFLNQFWRIIKSTFSLLCPLMITGKIKIAISNFKFKKPKSKFLLSSNFQSNQSKK